MSDELLTLQELAAALKVSVRKANELKAAGMPRVPITARTVRFRISEVLPWLEERVREQTKAAV